MVLKLIRQLIRDREEFSCQQQHQELCRTYHQYADCLQKPWMQHNIKTHYFFSHKYQFPEKKRHFPSGHKRVSGIRDAGMQS